MKQTNEKTMTNNKQQTAVDFAFETLANQGLLVYKEYTNLVAYREAKEMEKERIETAYNKGTVHGIDYPESILPITGEQYYNETYEGANQ
jgi:hypothetical protein